MTVETSLAADPIAARLDLKRRFPELDGVRGLAIALILLFHSFPARAFGSYIEPVFKSMWVGVDLFFVLSGFLITRILLGSKDAPNHWSVFYQRRAWRIFPAYFVALSLFLWVVPSLLPTMRPLQSLWPWFYGYSLNFYVLGHGSWPPSGELNHLWSLAVEEQFYLGWPLLIFALQPKRLPLLAGAICAVALAAKVFMATQGFAWMTLYTALFTRMDAFALGALVTYAYVYCSDWKAESISKLALGSSGLILGALFVSWRGFKIADATVQAAITPLMALFFSASLYLLLRAEPQSLGKRIFSGSTLRFLGKYSYGLYIYQWLVLHVVSQAPALAWIKRLPFDTLWVFLLTNALTFALTMASFHGLEAPLLKLRPKTPAS